VTSAADDPQPQAATLTPGAMGELALLMNAGRYPELENKSRQLLERHPDTGIVWQLLGIALWTQAKDPLAALQRAITLLPDDAGVHNNPGNALGRRARLDDAVASYRRVLTQLRAIRRTVEAPGTGVTRRQRRAGCVPAQACSRAAPSSAIAQTM
jgi:tetratricopeptide (TPR) repeat protein